QTEVREIQDKAVLDTAVEPIAELKPPGAVTGAGALYAVAHTGSNNMITLRYRLKELKVQAAEKEFKQGDTTFPAGSFLITGDAARMRAAIEPLGLAPAGLPAAPRGAMPDIDAPRVA